MGVLFYVTPYLVPHHIDISQFLFYQACLVTFSSLSTFLFFQDHPPTPPSLASTAPGKSFRDSFKDIWRIQAFWMVCLGYGCILTIYQTLTTLIQELSKKENYSPETSSLFFVTVIICGNFGQIVFPSILSKTKAWKTVVIGGSLFVAICNFVTAITFEYKQAYLTATILGFSGFFGLGIWPCIIELGAEVTFPIQGEYGIAIMTIVGNIFTTGLSYLLTYILEFTGPNVIFYCFGGISCICILSFTFMKPDYQRTKFEKQGYSVINPS